MLTDAPELGSFKELIIEKSEGNPLFIEEIVRALFENGTIVREGEQVRVTRPHAEISIPATVEGIVAARIDRLSPEEKSLLQSLAVIGEEFPLPLARYALGKPENELLKSLASLQSAEFIYERPTTAQIEYIFKHALIHDVAYKSVLQDWRKAIHGKTAETIAVGASLCVSARGGHCGSTARKINSRPARSVDPARGPEHLYDNHSHQSGRSRRARSVTQ